ncbi:MAG TPA: FHA domain-containing protein [Ktedonobacterales bacterium]|nr:FHA domain-containing protein [Ktedonobacterales bacterium]
MENLDFPIWFSVGCYGGLACSVLSGAGIAAYALLRHRGEPRQIARAILVCLVGSCLILPAIWWDQNRLELYGPAMDLREVLFWLTLAILAGWCAPLGMLAGYLSLAAPQATPAPGALTLAGTNAGSSVPLAALTDPARHVEPLGAGRSWGQLVPLNGEFAGTPLHLSRRLTLLGREIDNDIVVDDDRTSRHHAEIHWDHGHVELVDRNSMNGTLVNRRTVHGRVPMQSGDVLDFGAQRYRFELTASPMTGTTVTDEETRKMPGTPPARAATPAEVPLLLVGMTDSFAGKRWELRDAVVTIGRDAERQICLPHHSVSRLHAQIVHQQSGYYVSDLGSSNGTFLNGHAIAVPTLLLAGDVLRAGEIELRCEATPTEDQPLPEKGAEMRTLASAEPTLSLFIGQSSTAADYAERPRLAPPRLTASQPTLDATE